MTQSLEQYTAEALNAYKPATSAVQSQLDALQGQLDTANENINRSYAQQRSQLDNQAYQAARSASLNAAATGGAFGGQANIANRKYYQQNFVPAMTSLQTNQSNALATARQNTEDQRTNLNAQIANLQAQANQQALAQYYADQEAEKNRALQQQQLALQRQQVAAQNDYNKYMLEAYKQAAAQQEQAQATPTDPYGDLGIKVTPSKNTNTTATQIAKNRANQGASTIAYGLGTNRQAIARR